MSVMFQTRLNYDSPKTIKKTKKCPRNYPRPLSPKCAKTVPETIFLKNHRNPIFKNELRK